MTEYLIGFLFLVQAVSVLIAMFVGFKFGKGEPLIEKNRIALKEILFPPEKQVEYEVEEPPVSWEPRMSEYAEPEDK